MSPPDNITVVIVMAGFGIAAGVTALYNILINPESEGEPYPYHQNQSSSHLRRSPSPPSKSRSPKKPVLRAITSPPTIQMPVAVSADVSAASNSRNGISHRPGEITSCQLCKRFMRNFTIELDCKHIFHDECYTIWRYEIVMNNPHAKLCPIC